MWLSTVPKVLTGERADAALPQAAQRFAANGHFPAVRDLVSTRCSMCHAAEPVWEGLRAAPKDVVFESDKQIALHVREIYLQAGRSHAMPPGNLTGMTPQERALITAWFETSTEGS